MMTQPFDKARTDMDTMFKSVGTIARTAQTAGIEWTEFAKQSFAHGSETMKKLAAAKSPQAAMEIQTAFLRGSYERLQAQAKVIGELYKDMAKDIAKPLEGNPFVNKALVEKSFAAMNRMSLPKSA